jgi:hypothetical protein
MAVSPVVAPSKLQRMEGMIRDRTVNVLDALPRDRTFNWVQEGVDRADLAHARDTVRLAAG